ncbi:NnrS family protein [Salinarimonas sp.]|uniref:NnrS family protein n=1 Tax=Salinarimonas sp. TaxID=2766526 RepID=UPI0039190FAC
MATAQARTIRSGPAVLSLGLRPFFLAGALHAAFAMALFVPWYLGMVAPPSALPPLAWHAHELLFGYVPAIVAGFLLTAVPNWTGRAPLAGPPLAGLLALWLFGRLAILMGAGLPPVAIALASLAFPLALTAFVAHEILRAGNRRNLKIVGILVVLCAAKALFHAELAATGAAETAERIALAAIVLLVSIVAGRIVPAFTGNWMKAASRGPLPAPFGPLDRAAMILAGAALAAFAAIPTVPAIAAPAGALLLASGTIHLVRQLRWAPHRTLPEPLVTILHVGYLFVPAGFVLLGLDALLGLPGAGSAGLHAWSVGAIGVTTLAVMTRASLGHTGRALCADGATVAIYAAIVAAAILRILAALDPAHAGLLLPAAGLLWIGAFLGFASAYGRKLLADRVDA